MTTPPSSFSITDTRHFKKDTQFRSDIKGAFDSQTFLNTQVLAALRERQVKRFELATSDFEGTCTSKENHRIFLRALIEEAARIRRQQRMAHGVAAPQTSIFKEYAVLIETIFSSSASEGAEESGGAMKDPYPDAVRLLAHKHLFTAVAP